MSRLYLDYTTIYATPENAILQFKLKTLEKTLDSERDSNPIPSASRGNALITS